MVGSVSVCPFDLKGSRLLLYASLVGVILLVGAILSYRRFIDQIRAEGMDVGHRETGGRNEIAVRELAPAVAGRSENRAETALRLIILQQADVQGVVLRDVVIHAQDVVAARIGVLQNVSEIVLALPRRIDGIGKRETDSASRCRWG